MLHQDEHQLFFGLNGNAEKLGGLLRSRAPGMQHRAAPGPGGLGRFHHRVGVAAIHNGDNQIVLGLLFLHLRVLLLKIGGHIAHQIPQRAGAAHAVDGNGESNAAPGLIHIQRPGKAAHGPGGDGALQKADHHILGRIPKPQQA